MDSHLIKIARKPFSSDLAKKRNQQSKLNFNDKFNPIGYGGRIGCICENSGGTPCFAKMLKECRNIKLFLGSFCFQYATDICTGRSPKKKSDEVDFLHCTSKTLCMMEA